MVIIFGSGPGSGPKNLPINDPNFENWGDRVKEVVYITESMVSLEGVWKICQANSNFEVMVQKPTVSFGPGH